MKQQHFTTTMLVNQQPDEVFNAINNVKGWWSEMVEGNSKAVNDEFVYRHKDLHYSRQKLVEVVPGKKVVWLVTDSELTFLEKEKDEWTGTRISFELSPKGKKTQILFTHEGLVPEVECFDSCVYGWTYYLHSSLVPLINSGKGQPDKK